jgi:CHAT domain-containing protein
MALLEYFVTDDEIFIFVITNDRVGVVTVPESRENLFGRIGLFRGLAVQQMDETTLKEIYWQAPLNKLYQLLLASIETQGYLQDKKHLIIVPQGLLHYLPFQALVTQTKSKKDGLTRPRFLIEDYTISYVPSASSLKFLREKRKVGFGSLLLLAPKAVSLPRSAKEVIEIANMFKQTSEYYLNEEATETLLKTEAQNYDILHFATTAQFNKANPLFSRLELASSENDDGNLETHEIFGMELHANLVTLSACQTALGSGYSQSLPKGDDLVSLMRAFHYAGTPSVVASLWEVSDPSTAVFMQRFYKYLQKMSKAQALALTQRDMLDGKLFDESISQSINYSHPYFWAPFVLEGDWK